MSQEEERLLETVQRQTFAYFWDFAHPHCGLPKERDHEYYKQVVTTGGAGFGVMAIIVAIERKWISRQAGIERLLMMVRFLKNAETFHGAFPHWINGNTGKAIPFSKKDDGADLVETSFLFQGLLTARQYFAKKTTQEKMIRDAVTQLWTRVEWTWFTRNRKVLYWHWSPTHKWAMNLKIEGYNEALITYLLAAAAPQHAISADAYHEGWSRNAAMKNDQSFYGQVLPLGPDFGGPLFFVHYSFLGLDPRGLKDDYADYWKQNQAHAQINYRYCVDNPKGFSGYGPHCWGLSACDYKKRYRVHTPLKDNGTICCSAALSSMPYMPRESLKTLKYFYQELGPKIWGDYGFVESFNLTRQWYAQSFLAINQGPIILMIENFRTGLLWNLFMQDPDIHRGLQRLHFKSPHLKATQKGGVNS